MQLNAYDLNSHLKNYAPDRATGWFDRVKTRHADKMVARLRPWLPAEPAVLEIGPGHGHFARAITAAGARYDAIEPADVLRVSLQDAGFEVTAEAVPPIERPAGAYDLVYASMFIENLPTMREAACFVHEAARVLKPGGMLVLIYPNFLTWGPFFFEEHYTHSFITIPRRVGHMLKTQGFRTAREDHVLGWFTTEGGFARNLLRHAVNIASWPLETRLVYWTLRYLGLGELHWKLRKTLFEAVITIARRNEAAPAS